MAKDILELAWAEMRRRHFGTAIKMLEGRAEIYEDNAEYYIMLGTACLYVGDIGSASSCYQHARHINLTNTNLLLGQAAIYLRHGNTEKALHYYLEILENDPNNKTAKDAMEFIRLHGDYETICRWTDTGKIQQFFPPLGPNPDKIFYGSLLTAACLAGCIVSLFFLSGKKKIYDGPRRDLNAIVLTQDEKSNAQEADLSSQSYRYILSPKEITKSYEKALMYFQTNDDNRAQIEINRILNSNASLSIKQKANVVMTYLSIPSFDSLEFSPEYKDVKEDPYLYMDCYVIWSGVLTNVIISETALSANFLVGYNTGDDFQGDGTYCPSRYS
ncbi:MAG: hypothetical protein HUJ54_14440 [Erysipelotrichaceae bacterium]|nr:hypothetical protein [Erysipelotrichaceae bacterium]